jgi:hypothetical protein
MPNNCFVHGSDPEPEAPKLGQKGRHTHKILRTIPRKKILRIAKHANKAHIRTGALSQTHTSALQLTMVRSFLAEAPGAASGTAAAAAPEEELRSGPVAMARDPAWSARGPPATCDGDWRARPAGARRSGGRLGFGVWAPTEEILNLGPEEAAKGGEEKRRRSEGKRVTADEWMGNIFAVEVGFKRWTVACVKGKVLLGTATAPTERNGTER